MHFVVVIVSLSKMYMHSYTVATSVMVNESHPHL